MLSFRQVVRADESENVVMDYTPQKFAGDIKHVVKNFQNVQDEKEEGSDFRMSDVIKQQTGLNELEKRKLEDDIEKSVLERLGPIKESAYKEGYDLGRMEGQQEAFAHHDAAIQDGLARVEQLLQNLEVLKEEMIVQNEAHLMKMLGLLASKIAMRNLELHQENILPIIRRSVELSQAEENIIVRVNEDDLESIEQLRTEKTKSSDPLNKVRFIGDGDVASGGCVVETNYGTVDASLEERVNKLMGFVEENVPLVKEEISVGMEETT